MNDTSSGKDPIEDSFIHIANFGGYLNSHIISGTVAGIVSGTVAYIVFGVSDTTGLHDTWNNAVTSLGGVGGVFLSVKSTIPDILYKKIFQSDTL